MIPALLRTLARTGFRRAVSGAGGRGWLLVGIVAWTLRMLNKRSGEPKAILVDKLEPGHSIVITHYPKAGRH